jgi:D-alanyl-lipoteichoic acid acyltransferase DltB (MBOAT superfamily)
MLFNSLGFFLFLPVVLVIFWRLSEQWRWAWLLLASYGFYASFSPFNLLYLGPLTIVTLLLGQALSQDVSDRKRRFLLAAGIIATIGSLTVFKFYDFFAAEIERLMIAWRPSTSPIVLPRLGVTAPAGYSFFAFTAASYLIDTYRRKIETKPRVQDVALYIAYFPKILAGPIERATSFLPQMKAGVPINAALFTQGLQLIVWGLVKKVVIADNLAPFVDKTFKIAAYASPIDLLISIYFFAFQIYCDFSGYTDIAIGISLLFGIKLMENFRRPYLAKSTTEFWSQRWHISLSRWFRDYLYIPLSGSKAGEFRRYVNIMLVFVVSGLWHAGLGYGVGWTFLVWGALNGAYQWASFATRPIRSLFVKKMPAVSGSLPFRIMRVLLTFHLILFSWIFFRAQSVDQAILIIRKIWSALPGMPALVSQYPFTREQLFGVVMITLLLAIEILDERHSIWERLSRTPVALRWTVYYAVIFSLLILGRWQAKEFIYMQF